MGSRAISIGVGIPMIVAGGLIALFLPLLTPGIESTVEFVGSTIGILGVVFFIAGMLYAKEPILH